MYASSQRTGLDERIEFVDNFLKDWVSTVRRIPNIYGRGSR
jgi:hypothetical protein